MNEHAELPTASPELVPRRRLLSLDVFRGFDIAAMILVNMTWDRATLPWQMFHVGWNGGAQGVTLTDLVFPWFIFIAGVAIPFSMRSGRGRGHTAAERVLIALRRAMVIYLLGLLLDAASSGRFVFFKWNILQLIAGAYFFAVCIAMLPRWLQVGFVVAVLAVKWWILSVYHHPDFGRSVWFFAVDGVEVADRYAAGAVPINGEQVFKSAMLGWASWLPFSGTVSYSPLLNWLTNIFNLLPAICVAVMGSWIGRWVLAVGVGVPALGLRLIGVGVACWFLSWLWNLHHAWSKDFFTASYALLAVGTGTAVLGVFYLLLDTEWRFRLVAAGSALAVGAVATASVIVGGGLRSVWAEWSIGTLVGGAIAMMLLSRPGVVFFRAFGMNAIALYFVNEMLFKMVFSKWTLPLLDPERPMTGALYHLLRRDWAPTSTIDLAIGGWAFALVWLGGCFGFVFWLDRRGVFIRV
ncbi:MAG: heparan-alpha-glucosaminide N-acetyltransferase domain-containing protein [Phycisphaerales bacterium]